MWHGETHTLKKFYEIDKKLDQVKKTVFSYVRMSPVAYVSSAITFSGFDNFYYLFPYNVQIMNLVFLMI